MHYSLKTFMFPLAGDRRLRRALGVAVDRQLPMFLKWNKRNFLKLTSNIEDLLPLLPTTIIYSFEGSEQEAQVLLDKGFYLGISCRCVSHPSRLLQCLFPYHFFLFIASDNIES